MNKRNSHNDAHSVSGTEEYGFTRTLAFSLIGGIVGSVLTIILIIICSFFSLSKDDPAKLIGVFGTAIPPITYFAGGFLSCRLSRRAPLICGIVCAASMMTFIKCISLAFAASENTALSVPIKVVLCIAYALISIIGAIIAANLSSKKKRGNKHRAFSRK